MKILLLGANGQVGHALRETLARPGELVCATRDGTLDDGGSCMTADLGEPASLAGALDAVRPGIVVNAAAYTAVDRAEDEPAHADRINHLAVGEIGAWAAAHDALVVHYSTDYVFDGHATRPYHEDDATAPAGIYARSKCAGEAALRASGARHFILRTAWVYAARGNNFLRTMLRLAGERDTLRVVADQTGSPTPARWIAQATARMLDRWLTLPEGDRMQALGTYHLVAGGRCSWADFARAIVAAAADGGIIAVPPGVIPIATSDFPTRARRPRWSVLDATKLHLAFGIQLPAWEAGLRDVMAEITASRA